MAARRKKAADDHVCPSVDEYLLTYSDMITALLVLFIVLFAMGQIDIAKFEKFKQGIARSGATPIDDGLLENGEGVFEQAIIRPELISSPDDHDGPGGTGGSPGRGGGPGEGGGTSQGQRQALEQAQSDITQSLEGVEVGSDISFRTESRGLVITIVSEGVLFEPGSSGLSPDGERVVSALATGLDGLPNKITIEGHTDSIPIATARFPSNWELSVGRASTVLRALADQHGFDPARLSAAGYADQRPIASNETPVGRQANRRVEVVVNNVVPDPEPTFGEGA